MREGSTTTRRVATSLTSSGARGEKSIKRSSEQRKARPASRVRDRLDHRSGAGGKDHGRRSVGRGRPILLPGRRTRGRDEQAKGRSKTLRRRHARAKAPGTCAHIPSLRRSPSPLLSRSLAHSRSANPSVLRRFPLLRPRPVFAHFGGLPTALPRSLPSNDRSVGLSCPPSVVASPREVRPRCSLRTTGGAKQFFVGAEAACRACIGAVQ